jgi:hypothetical protein
MSLVVHAVATRAQEGTMLYERIILLDELALMQAVLSEAEILRLRGIPLATPYEVISLWGKPVRKYIVPPRRPPAGAASSAPRG